MDPVVMEKAFGQGDAVLLQPAGKIPSTRAGISGKEVSGRERIDPGNPQGLSWEPGQGDHRLDDGRRARDTPTGLNTRQDRLRNMSTNFQVRPSGNHRESLVETGHGTAVSYGDREKHRDPERHAQNTEHRLTGIPDTGSDGCPPKKGQRGSHPHVPDAVRAAARRSRFSNRRSSSRAVIFPPSLERR